MDIALQPYGGFSAVVVFRMLLAVICGMMVGIERQLKGHSVAAGCKTFCLVCLGAALAMLTNEYIVISGNGTGDLARMAAQVISGIGFLGAGTIITTGSNKIRGLATAASLWVTAALGISIGTGFYIGAAGGVICILISTAMCNVAQKLVNQRSRIMRIQLECINEAFMLQLIEYITRKNFRIMTITRHSENKWYKKDICVIIEMDLHKRMNHDDILQNIRSMNGVRYIEEIW